MSETKILIVVDEGRVWEVYRDCDDDVEVIVEHIDDQVFWLPPCEKDEQKIEMASFLAKNLNITREKYKELIKKKKNR